MAKRSALKNVFRLIESETNTLEPQESFLADLKRSIELDDAKNSRLPSKTYKPSSMNCMRVSYYQIKGVEPDEGETNYTLIGICNSGSDIHVRIQTAISRMKLNGMDCEYVDVAEFVKQRNLTYLDIVSQNGMETKLYHKKLNISFLCDGIIKYKNKYYILELKTESSYKFINRKEVDPKHYNQAITYSLALGIDEVIFVYINRDLLDMKSFCFCVTNKMKESIQNYIADCDSYLVTNMVPPKLDEKDKRNCTYCSYKTQCRKDK